MVQFFLPIPIILCTLHKQTLSVFLSVILCKYARFFFCVFLFIIFLSGPCGFNNV